MVGKVRGNALRSAQASLLIVVAVVTLVASRATFGQTTNPAYVAEMPTVDRVKAEIKGSDDIDTQARQVAVFTYLAVIMDRIRGHRGYSAPLTPDEQRVKGQYDVAAYQMTQNFPKTHSPEQAKAFTAAEGRYEFDASFRSNWYTSLLSPNTRSIYETGQIAEAAHAKAHFDAERQQGSGAPVRTAPSGSGAVPAQHSSIGIFGDAVDAANNASILDNDPQTKAARRCLELGGTKAQCLGAGATEGIMEIMSMLAPGLTKQAKADADAFHGLRLGGSYRAVNGLELGFGGAASVDHCGQLVPDSHSYSVSRHGAEMEVEVQTQPAPLKLVLGPGGELTGPGLFTLNGRVITGYEVYNVQKRYADGTIVPGSAHQERVPVYAPRTERCTFTAFRPVAAPIADGSPAGLFTMFFGEEESDQTKLNKQHPTMPGLRMAGSYASSGGLRLDFQQDVVILDCGEAHTLASYSVRNGPAQVQITVDDRSGPFTVALQQNGDLAGAGAAVVAGKIVTGETRDGFSFRPSRQSCVVGSLVPASSVQ